jgi:amino acid adenylation domain-containing protein
MTCRRARPSSRSLGRRPDPTVPIPRNWYGSIQARVLAHSRLRPDQPAVAWSDGHWTYLELSRHSLTIAHLLRKRGVVPGDTVAIFAPRGAPAALAMLAVMEAGAAFALLAPNYPEEWTDGQVQAARPRGWINLSADTTVPRSLKRSPVLIDTPLFAELCAATASREVLLPCTQTGPDDVAYISFTSGTTGTPNAVIGSHAPLSHFFEWYSGWFGLGHQDRFAMMAGLGHDPLLRDIFGAWWVGATVFIPGVEPSLAPDDLGSWLARRGITVAHLTPSLARLLLRASDEIWPELLHIFFAGEPLESSDIRAFAVRAPRARCVNFYGTTETPQAMSFHVATNAMRTGPNHDATTIPIGKGIDGVQLLVIDEHGRLAPVGQTGEICVRTPYLSLGYLNNPELTASRFVPNPFGSHMNDRVYRTGDRGVYQVDGSVTCTGRLDSQVKIRGLRIELDAIERLLRSHPDVLDAVVLKKDDGRDNEVLVAYVVLAHHSPDTAHLRQFLSRKLPRNAVPGTIVAVEQLPLTPSGKPDRQRLVSTEVLDLAGESPIEVFLLELLKHRFAQYLSPSGALLFGQESTGDARALALSIRSDLKADVTPEDVQNARNVTQLALHILGIWAEATPAAEFEDLFAAAQQGAKPASCSIKAHADGYASGHRFRLLIVINDRFEAATFERLAACVREFDPAIEAVVYRDEPGPILAPSAVPTAVFSPAALRHRERWPGRIYSGFPLAKSEEYRILERAGFPVPCWQTLTPDSVLDLSRLGELVVRKPDRGGAGRGVRLLPAERVRWKPRYGSGEGLTHSMIVQRFIYTGPRPISYRVNTLFGNALYAIRHQLAAGRPEFPLSPDKILGESGLSIVASARGSQVEFCNDADILALAERAHSVFPELPLLGFDIVREVPTGKLFILEANSIGYVWYLDSKQVENFGFELETQFDGLNKAARILARVTREHGV